MGAEPYEYIVPYVEDVQAALEALRQQVFNSGEFYPAELNPSTPQEAMEMAAENGTRSILDILSISETPDFCCAAPYSSEELLDFFGTEKPTKETLRKCDAYWDDLDRGMARYVVLYEGDEPRYLYFVGYSFD